MKLNVRWIMSRGQGVVGIVLFGVLWSCSAAKQEVRSEPAAAVQAPKEKNSDEIFKEGVAAYEGGRYPEAADLFNKVLAREPQHIGAGFNLGLVAERQGDLAKAEQAYQAAHQLDATHEPTLLNLGKVYRLQGKFDKAIALYEAALKDPAREYDVELLNNLTVAYRLAKNFAKAEATARKVLARTKDNPDAYKNLSLIYYDQGNYRLAEFISANARKLDEKDPGVYNNLGMIYLKMDDRPRALAEFQKAVSLDPKFAPGHMNIGAMALSFRDYEAAEKAFARAISLDPNSYEGHLYYAFALDGLKGRDPKKGPLAGAEFERVLALRPDVPEAVCGAGWAYSAEKSGWDKAESFLNKCRSLPSTQGVDQQLIDAKLKSLAAMKASGQQQGAQAAPKKEAPKPGAAGLLDKVADEAAKQEAQGTETPPAEQTAPAPEGHK